ncbi:alpha/beta hydrolase [Kineococcus gynurae]|uniref:Alpha/beta hydrolase n=1 Tax=Kineococcus gynurae TaxID=452979 RepID=A0ABV5LXE4_9ACTN
MTVPELRAPTVTLDPRILRALRPPDRILESPVLVGAVCAGFLLLLVATVLLWRRTRRGRGVGRRSRWVARGGSTLLTLVAAVLAVATVVNAAVGYVPTLQAAETIVTGTVDAGAGTVVTREVAAPELGVTSATTLVYLPPGYAEHPRRRYPVVYLVHGSPGRSTDWFAAGDAARTLDVLITRREIPPVIAVAPDVNGSGFTDTECLNSPTGGPQIETYLETVLVPWVDGTFRTDARPGARILGGMSAGGFCALDQGLRHRGTWGPILAIEPFGDPGPAWRDQLDPEQFDAVSPAHYLPTIELPAPVPVFLSTGSEVDADELRGVDELERLLQRRGEPVLRHDVVGGGHTWSTAQEALPFGLVYLARFLPADDGGTPAAG